ncbi:DUF2975 domain-containing protein [uncultured Flavobacterium sp.]|uniref:DUF2975 domain-containing protein n=1 Tax=uncultured Flavobacterium sp. TaxID=165435 RepID=UPI0025EAB946|nr:DUF2975 domain-containing protein [uncultured Flavobacterium sp.]
MITIAFVPGFILLLIISPESVPAGIRIATFSNDHGIGFIGTLALMFAGYCFFVYALYLFGKVLDLFSKRKIFDDLVIKYLNRIGQLILGGLALIAIPPHIYRLFTQNPININADSGTLSLVIFTICFGLFFMVLSEVFLMAKGLKEENDLTV